MMPRLSDDDNELAVQRWERERGRGDETESGYQAINTES